jgi:hypothetical protein
MYIFFDFLRFLFLFIGKGVYCYVVVANILFEISSTSLYREKMLLIPSLLKGLILSIGSDSRREKE